MKGPCALRRAVVVLVLGAGAMHGSVATAQELPWVSTSPASGAVAPNEPPAVPNPGPAILGGRLASPEHLLPPVRWRWGRDTVADYVVGGAAGVATLVAAIVPPLPTHQIEGGILFDDAVRNAVRPAGIQVRYAFRDASNVELSVAATWPFFVDALTTVWWYHGDRDTAQAMAVLDLETLAIAGAVQGVTNVVVSRPRPYASSCGTPELPQRGLRLRRHHRVPELLQRTRHVHLHGRGSRLPQSHGHRPPRGSLGRSHLRRRLRGGSDDLGLPGPRRPALLQRRPPGRPHGDAHRLRGALSAPVPGHGRPRGHLLQLVPSTSGLGLVGRF